MFVMLCGCRYLTDNRSLVLFNQLVMLITRLRVAFSVCRKVAQNMCRLVTLPFFHSQNSDAATNLEFSFEFETGQTTTFQRQVLCLNIIYRKLLIAKVYLFFVVLELVQYNFFNFNFKDCYEICFFQFLRS